MGSFGAMFYVLTIYFQEVSGYDPLQTGLAFLVPSNASVLPGIVLYAIGQGMTWTAMWIAAASGVDPAEQGVASGMSSTAMQVGSAIGLALLVAVANAGVRGAASDARRQELPNGLSHAAYIAAAGIVVGALVALTRFAPRRGTREQSRCCGARIGELTSTPWHPHRTPPYAGTRGPARSRLQWSGEQFEWSGMTAA
jgi:hypothetical protein